MELLILLELIRRTALKLIDKNMKTLILSEFDINNSKELLLKSDLVIHLHRDRFDVMKNRYGKIVFGLPISILQKVIEKPNGKLIQDWK